jgi:hypothetical protein
MIIVRLFFEGICSASARILKGQGYQGFLRKRAGSRIGKLKYLRGQNKNKNLFWNKNLI